MNATELFFKLRPSILKILLQCVVLLGYISLATTIMSSLWLVLSIVFFVVLIGVWRPMYKIDQFDHMEGKTWTLHTTDKKLLQGQLHAIQSFGYVVFCHFCLENTQKMHTICVVKDQISREKWRILQQFCRVY